MKKLFAILTFIGFWSYGMGQSGYWPLKKGQTLLYAYTSEYNQGNDALRSKITTLEKTKTINGKEYFITETSLGSNDNFLVITSSHSRVANDGSIRVLESDGKSESIALGGTLKVGETWESKKGEVSSVVKIVDLSTQVTTPIKTYTNCLVLEGEENGMLIKSYFKKGIGMVAIGMVMEGKEKLFTYLVD